MKSLIILIFAVTVALATSAQTGKNTKSKSKSGTTNKLTYSCPMHPDVVMNKPGKCSKCGMDLTKSKKEQMKMDVMKIYSCPMHPEEVSDKPGSCSKCGMKLVEKKSHKKGKTSVTKV